VGYGAKFGGAVTRDCPNAVFNLQNGEYHLKRYRQNQLVDSLFFPEIKLSTSQIFKAYGQ
jgi:Uma2 family endonuclease